MLDSDLIRDIDFEISSICNAGCSVCMRREHGHFTNFEQTYWSLNEVKRVLDVDIVKNLLGFNICGNFGDVMGNPQVVEIIEWVRSINKTCSIVLRTNGGIGEAEQYKRLAELRVMICFGIDGIGENNELYRVNVKWDKLFENFTTFAKYAEPWQKEIQFLLWGETAMDILPIVELAEKYECGFLHLRKPYTTGILTEVYDMKGRSTHFLTQLNDPSANFIMDTRWKLTDYPKLKERIKNANIKITPLLKSDLQIKPKIEKNEREYEVKSFTKEPVTCGKQTCFSKNRNDSSDLKNSLFNVYITYNKLLMPCCMIPPYISNFMTHSADNETTDQIEILNRMKKIGFDNFSLKNKTLKEVINSGVLRQFVYDDLENGTPFNYCKKICCSNA
jgi:hypothetical protein